MGQRHQIYLRVPAVKYGAGNPNNAPAVTIGIHHQWLYGFTAIRLLRNFLRYCEKAGHPEGELPYALKSQREAGEVLSACYSFDAEEGYYHCVSPLRAWNKDSKGNYVQDETEWGDECKDPRKGDNNNGITIIDVSGDKPRYCFLNIGGLECLEGEQPKKLNPLNAMEWIKLHYVNVGADILKSEKRNDGRDRYCCNKEYLKEMETVAAGLLKYETLTREQVKKIFPQLFKKEKAA